MNASLLDIVNTYYLNTCKWIGTAATIVGALATAGGFDPVNIIAFNLGAVFWLLASIRMKDAALMSVNAGLLGIYALGAVVRFI
jgi:hypothetical protein